MILPTEEVPRAGVMSCEYSRAISCSLNDCGRFLSYRGQAQELMVLYVSNFEVWTESLWRTEL